MRFSFLSVWSDGIYSQISSFTLYLVCLKYVCVFTPLYLTSIDRQVYKTIADVEGGRALYDGYSEVTTDGSHDFLRIRETVLLRKVARKLFVQANTTVSG